MKILVFGDSISRWAFDQDMWGWVERLKTHFFQWWQKNYKHGVYNYSISSNDTRGVLEQISVHCDLMKKINPDDMMIILSIWSNDARYMQTPDQLFVPKQEFISNIERILDRCRIYTENIMILWLLPVDQDLCMPRHGEYYDNTYIQEYDAILKDIAHQRWYTYIDMRDCINISTDLDDGLHPNTQGHVKIYERVKKEIDMSLLKEAAIWS